MTRTFGCVVVAEKRENLNMQNAYAMKEPRSIGVETLRYKKTEIRVVRVNSSHLFWVVRDIAYALGFSEPHNASRKIPTHTLVIPTAGGAQPVATVDKDGLWQILYRGRRPGLKEFREWVAFEAMEILTGEAVEI